MTDAFILAGIRDVARKHLDWEGSLEPKMRLVEDLALDSIKLLTLAVEVENHFKICLDPERDHELITVADLVAAIRVRARITSAFRIPSAQHLRLGLNQKMLNVGKATPPTFLNRPSQICSTSGRAKPEVILARTLSRQTADKQKSKEGNNHRDTENTE